MELYKKYRPKTFKELIGQGAAVKALQRMCKRGTVPQALGLFGPSGCGKTTTAYILQPLLDCVGLDFHEYNAANDRGIDMVRQITSDAKHQPLRGKSHIFLLDEAHQLSSQAQNALLKLLENTPPNAYFMLATTDHDKLIATVRNRLTPIEFCKLGENEVQDLVKSVLAKEKKELASEEVLEQLCRMADGSARKALVLLGTALELDTEDEQLEAIKAGEEAQIQAIEIARILLKNKPNWNQLAKVLRVVKEEPETMRRMVLGYANTILLSKGSHRAAMIIHAFETNLFDSGRAGFNAACYDLCQSQ